MKKITSKILLILCMFLVGPTLTKAACNISVSGPNNVVVGSTFRITTSVSQDVGSWYYILSYDSSKVRLVSGSPKVVGVIGDARSKSYTFKSLKSGTANFRVTNADMTSNSTNKRCSVSAGSKNVTMRTQAEIEESYSRNNNLSELSVTGAELSPAFSSDVLEYNAELPVDTEKAVINATVQDKTAQISGAGEVNVIDGLNKIEVVVTAQHGEKKTYVINLTVKELDPVKVKIDGKNYSVVRKENPNVKVPESFTKEKIKIENQEVVAYKNKQANITLVVLKDDNAKMNLYIYNDKEKTYNLFINAVGNSNNLVILDKYDGKLKDFEKTTFNLNDTSVNGYKLKDGTNNYYLVYAQNLENGEKDLYLYDTKEKTFQKFYLELLNKKNDQLKVTFLIAVLFIILFAAMIIIKLLDKMFLSKEKKIKRYQRKIEKLKNKMEYDYEEYDLNKLDDKPEIKKIDDEYVIPKKTKKQKLREIREAKEKLDTRKNKIRRVSLEDDY